MNEPVAEYRKREIVVFNSFEEQETYELNEMALLIPFQLLQQLRSFINIAYGMQGYDPKKLPEKHTVRVINSEYEHLR